MEDMDQRVIEAVKFIKTQIYSKPDIAIILGSGLGALAYEIQDSISIPFEQIPYFKKSTVKGHEGNLIFGKIYGKSVVAMQGRLHYYEGYSMQDVTFPVRVFALLGVEVLIVTNAGGGINPAFNIGDLMLITDHINLSGTSPLIGRNYELFGPRFPSLLNVYNKQLLKIAKGVANEMNFNIHEGVYAYITGPQYPTEAEIKMLGLLGASAVGMSTVPEVIAASHSDIDVLGISCITHVASAQPKHPTTHAEILENASKYERDFISLVKDTIRQINISDYNVG